MKTAETKPCVQCGTVYYRRIRQSVARWEARRFCSRPCRHLAETAAALAPSLKTCSRCTRALPQENFAWKTKAHRQRTSSCRECSLVINRGRIRTDRKPARSAERDPIKQRARQKLQRAVRSGLIRRLPCEVCGALVTEAHHPDYSKPLDVQWLCKRHHEEVHSLPVHPLCITPPPREQHHGR
jgi:hypothetical protein